MDYISAKAIADNLLDLFAPHCEKINIAGSIRRERYHVKDIEVVCLPKKEFNQVDLFGGGYYAVSREFATAVTSVQKEIIKGSVNGRYMQMMLKENIILDLFLPQPHDYYRQLAIRTGSAQYSAEVIARAWKKKGWVGTSEGLRLKNDCSEVAKNTWICINRNAELPPVWNSEEEFFHWLNLKWLQPAQRELNNKVSI
jgi:DNA polymerase/3'-5' exonuclease PolX